MWLFPVSRLICVGWVIHRWFGNSCEYMYLGRYREIVVAVLSLVRSMG
jgi:hypothetical protein